MIFNKVNPTNFLTSGLNIVFTIVFGTLYLSAVVMGIDKYNTAVDNKQTIAAMDVVGTADLHLFKGAVFHDNGMTYSYRACMAIENERSGDHWDITPPPFPNASIHPDGGAFCDTLFSDLDSWKDYAGGPSADGADIVWTVVCAGIFLLLCGFGAASISFAVVALLPSKITWISLPLSMLLAIIPLLGSVIFIGSAMTSVPTYWESPTTGIIVETSKVFVTSDGKLYKSPQTPYDWSDYNAIIQLGELPDEAL